MTANPNINDNLGKHYLYPGKIFCSKQPHEVHTILGSCVAVSLWDVTLLYSGINHYMLPQKENATSFKYGNVAIAELIKQMTNMGSARGNIKAKIFGGSELSDSNGLFNIGARNIVFAKNMLKNEGIPIVSFSVGGHVGRKVIFYTASGEVLVSFMKTDLKVADQKGNDNISNFFKK